MKPAAVSAESQNIPLFAIKKDYSRVRGFAGNPIRSAVDAQATFMHESLMPQLLTRHRLSQLSRVFSFDIMIEVKNGIVSPRYINGLFMCQISSEIFLFILYCCRLFSIHASSIYRLFLLFSEPNGTPLIIPFHVIRVGTCVCIGFASLRALLRMACIGRLRSNAHAISIVYVLDFYRDYLPILPLMCKVL